MAFAAKLLRQVGLDFWLPSPLMTRPYRRIIDPSENSYEGGEITPYS